MFSIEDKLLWLLLDTEAWAFTNSQEQSHVLCFLDESLKLNL